MPEKSTAEKLTVIGLVALFLTLIVATCATSSEKSEPEPVSELGCTSPMDSPACLEEHNVQRRRERVIEQMQDEGLLD